MPKTTNKADAARATLRKLALGYPGTREEFPWGERVVKVGKKVFVFLGMDDGDFGMSVKLPESGSMALMLPFAEPTGYGLGKSGWVSVRFAAKQSPPVDLLAEWIDESYRAVAPAKLVAKLGVKEATPPRKSAARKPSAGQSSARAKARRR
jgi:predicted DNA-binding protein (MmcQ/YjbR family)